MGVVITFTYTGACLSQAAETYVRSGKIPQPERHPAVSGFSSAKAQAAAECYKVCLHSTVDSGSCASEERDGAFRSFY